MISGKDNKSAKKNYYTEKDFVYSMERVIETEEPYSEMSVSGAVYSGKLMAVSFTDCEFNSCRFEGTDFSRSGFSNCIFSSCDFSNCDLTDTF